MAVKIRDNRFLSIVFFAECIFFVILFICSIHSPFSITIPADTMILMQSDKLSYSGGGISVSDTTGTGSADLILSSQKYRLPSGSYELDITYTAKCADTVAPNADTGYISVTSEDYGHHIHCGNVPLRFDRTIQRQQLWIPFGYKINDLKINVYYNHIGTLSLDSVSLKESVSWRVTRFIGFFLIFLISDLILLVLYLPDDKVPHRKTILCLTAIILVSSLPYMNDFLYEGHDLWFHLERITSLAAELSAGHFPARIESTMLNGYGYPFSLYYGDIFLYLPAALCNLHVPVQLCYQIYAILVSSVTCIISYFSFREISGGEDTLGLVGSLLYTFSSYRLVNLLVRSAVGEYTAMAFIPLIFLGLYRMYFKKNDGSIKPCDFLPIVFGFSGILESHVLTAIISLIFILLFFIFFIKRSVDPARISAWCWTVIIIIGLNLWFLLPFIESMNMKITGNDPEIINQIQSQGTYLLQLFSIGIVNVTGHSVTGTKEEMPLSIGIALTAGLLMYIFCLISRKKWKLDSDPDYRLGIYFLLSAVAALYISSVYFPWDSLRSFDYNTARFLCQVQFPWRYLSVASFFLTGTAVFSLKYIRSGAGRRYYRCSVLFIIISAAIYAGLFYGSYLSNDDEGICYSQLDSGTGDIMGQEYLLMGTTYDLMNDSGLILNSTSLSASMISRTPDCYVFSCYNNSGHSSSVDIPILAYDNYKAYIKGTCVRLYIRTGSNNRLRVIIPASFNDIIEVRYEEPASWRWSEFISLITLLSLIVHNLFTFHCKKVN